MKLPIENLADKKLLQADSIRIAAYKTHDMTEQQRENVIEKENKALASVKHNIDKYNEAFNSRIRQQATSKAIIKNKLNKIKDETALFALLSVVGLGCMGIGLYFFFSGHHHWKMHVQIPLDLKLKLELAELQQKAALNQIANTTSDTN